MARGVLLGDRISEMLGRRHPRSSVVSSASLAVICLFYVYTVGTFFQVRIYPLIDRVTHYISFNYYIVNEYVDHVVIGALLVLWFAFSVKRTRTGYVAVGAFATIVAAATVVNNDLALDAIALAALPAMATLLIYSKFSIKKILNNDSRLWINYIAIIGIVIGIISFAIAVSTIATENTPGYPIERNYAYGVFVLFSSASPILMLLLITSFPVKLLIDFVRSKVGKLSNLDSKEIIEITAKKRAIYLALFVLFSIIIAIIPHLGTVNPDRQQVGVDTGYYVNWVGALNNSTSAQDFLYQAFVQQRGGDRPVSLVFIYALQETGTDLFSVVEFSPLILGPALVLAVYFLTRELTLNDVISLLAAFLTAISFQTMIGIYAGFYSNWLALIIGYVSFVFLLRFLKRGGKENLALFLGLLTLTLFTHVYTWSILAIVAGIFLLTMLKSQSFDRRNTALLLTALFVTVSIDLIRVILTGSSGGIEEDLSLVDQLVGLDQFTLRWNNLTYATTTFVGGIIANFMVLGLGLYWLFGARFREPASFFIFIFLSIGILPFLIGEWQIQTRVFYNIPFQIPATIALFQIKNQTSGSLRVIPICIWLVAIALVTISNFYFISPNLQAELG